MRLQFRSISYGLFGTEAYHKAVRRKAVQYLREHQAEFEAFLGDDFDGWLKEMSQNDSWGDELTLVSILRATACEEPTVCEEGHMGIVSGFFICQWLNSKVGAFVPRYTH